MSQQAATQSDVTTDRYWAGLRQRNRRFARRNPAIERGGRPGLFNLDDDVDRRLRADWVRSPTAAEWYSSLLNLNLTD